MKNIQIIVEKVIKSDKPVRKTEREWLTSEKKWTKSNKLLRQSDKKWETSKNKSQKWKSKIGTKLWKKVRKSDKLKKKEKWNKQLQTSENSK